MWVSKAYTIEPNIHKLLYPYYCRLLAAAGCFEANTTQRTDLSLYRNSTCHIRSKSDTFTQLRHSVTSMPMCLCTIHSLSRFYLWTNGSHHHHHYLVVAIISVSFIYATVSKFSLNTRLHWNHFTFNRASSFTYTTCDAIKYQTSHYYYYYYTLQYLLIACSTSAVKSEQRIYIESIEKSLTIFRWMDWKMFENYFIHSSCVPRYTEWVCLLCAASAHFCTIRYNIDLFRVFDFHNKCVARPPHIHTHTQHMHAHPFVVVESSFSLAVTECDGYICIDSNKIQP